MLEEYLYETIKQQLKKWKDKPVAAISFLAYANECNRCKDLSNLPCLSIGYCTKDIYEAILNEEDPWSLANVRVDETDIIQPQDDDKGTHLMCAWFCQQGIQDVGFEDESGQYDDEMVYIGKGPNGYYEFLMLVASIANKLRNDSDIKEKLRGIPIIIHDFEYPWYIADAIRKANPHGEAKPFLDVSQKCCW